MTTTRTAFGWLPAAGAAVGLLGLLGSPLPTAWAEPTATDQTSSQQTTEQQPPGPEQPRSGSGVSAPRLHGTYNNTSTLNGSTATGINQISSPCGGCNAVVTVNGMSVEAVWTGTGWSVTTPAACGPVVASYTPTSVVNGFVQTASGIVTGMCGVAQPILSTLVRVG
jgi:hypothetical protein